jgi:hypothetical protein
MYMLEHDLARGRMDEMQAEAAAALRARRLYLARRAARRAERAVRRAAHVLGSRHVGPRRPPDETRRPQPAARYSLKPGSHSSMTLRKSPAASSWHSTPIDPIVTRWMRR